MRVKSPVKIVALLSVICPLCSNAAQQGTNNVYEPFGQPQPPLLGQLLPINVTSLGSDFTQLVPVYNQSLQLLTPLALQLASEEQADGEIMDVETRDALTDSFKRHMAQIAKVSTTVQELATAAVIQYPPNLEGLQDSPSSTFSVLISLIECLNQDKCYRSVQERMDHLNATCAKQQRLVSEIDRLRLSCDGRQVQSADSVSSPNSACVPRNTNATRDNALASLTAPLVFGFLPLCSLLNLSSHGSNNNTDELDLKLAVLWCLHASDGANITGTREDALRQIPPLDCDLFRHFFSSGPKFLALAGELLALAHSVSLSPPGSDADTFWRPEETAGEWDMFTDKTWMYRAIPSQWVVKAFNVSVLLSNSTKPLESIVREADSIIANESFYDDPLTAKHGIERIVSLAAEAFDVSWKIGAATGLAPSSVEQLNHSISLHAANNAANIALWRNTTSELRNLIDQTKAEIDLIEIGRRSGAFKNSADLPHLREELGRFKSNLVLATYKQANEESAPPVLEKMLASLPAFVQHWRQFQKNFEDLESILLKISVEADLAKWLLHPNPVSNSLVNARSVIQAILGVKHLSFLGKSIARAYLRSATSLAKLVSLIHAVSVGSNHDLWQKLAVAREDQMNASTNVEEVLRLVYEIVNTTSIGHRSELLASLVAEAADVASQLQLEGVKVYNETQALIRDDWNKAALMLAKKAATNESATAASAWGRLTTETGVTKHTT